MVSRHTDIFNDSCGTGTGSTYTGTGSSDTGSDNTYAGTDSADTKVTPDKELLPALESQPYEYKISESVLYVIVQLKKPFHLKSKGSAIYNLGYSCSCEYKASTGIVCFVT